MTIIPQDPTCPAWCMAHVPTDPGAVHHIGVDRTVEFTGGGPAESGWASVSVERFDGSVHPITTEVHLDTVGGPMHPVEALQLSVALQRAAFGALGLGASGTWADTQRWAQEFVATPAADADGQRIQEIVADLLERAEHEQS